MPIRRKPADPISALAQELTQDARWLRGVLQRALGYSLASSLALAGCGDGDDAAANANDAGVHGPLITHTQPTAKCDAGGWQLAPNFTLAYDVDYIADRREDNTIISQRGEPCAAASDQTACEAALAQPFEDRHLVTIEGDTVRLWNHASALHVLGAIDVPEEAIWWLQSQNYNVECDAKISFADGQFMIAADRPDAMCPFDDRVFATVAVDAHGTIDERSGKLVKGSSCVVGGRRPEGWVSTHRVRATSRLGEHFAAMAQMEAASVPAFAAIARELKHHAAPAALVAAAERARRDEMRHARMASRLALRFGARATWPVVQHMPLRSLEAFALDNAVEGCVNETYAAAEATHQAAQASDVSIRRAMRAIAADETRHAALSWQIARWVTPQLDKAAHVRIAGAQRAAVERLGSAVHDRAGTELCALAGLPDENAARALHASLTRELWDVQSKAARRERG